MPQLFTSFFRLCFCFYIVAYTAFLTKGDNFLCPIIKMPILLVKTVAEKTANLLAIAYLSFFSISKLDNLLLTVTKKYIMKKRILQS